MEKNAFPIWLQSIVDYIQKELDNPRIYQQIVTPIVRKVMWILVPYALCFMCLNFFTTILAVGLVIYFRHRTVPRI
jgi:hypothetical protein